MSDTISAPTWASCLTPAGAGAIAVLALRGPRAWEIATRLFRPRNDRVAWPPPSPLPGQFWLGRMGAQTTSGTADDVILTCRELKPVPFVEIHCHGGREVVHWLLETIVSCGAQSCTWKVFGEHTHEARLRSEAEVALAHAPTLRTAAILLDQVQGAFSRALDSIRAESLQSHVSAMAKLRELARFAPLGRHLNHPWKVAVLGAPNVGKSSFINALAGYQRSIVAATAGTTRDVVTTSIAIDGWPVELLDTAGLRDAADKMEEQGVERARLAARRADLCLWILDTTQPPMIPPTNLPNVHVLVNKTDLPPIWDFERSNSMRISARTGAGLPKLCEDLAYWLVPDPPPPGAAVPFAPELAEAIENALARGDLSDL